MKTLFPGFQRASAWAAWPHEEENVFIEPKIVGIRLAIIVDVLGVLTMHHAGALPATWDADLRKIRDSIRATGIRQIMFDGVLSTLNRQDDSVCYYISDCVPLDVEPVIMRVATLKKGVLTCPVSQERRYSLRTASIVHRATTFLQAMPRFPVYSPAHMLRMHDELIDMGFERAIVKTGSAPYVFARSPFWQEIQPMPAVLLTVVKALVGRGSKPLRGFECTLPTGESVQCTDGFSDEARKQLWQRWRTNNSDLVGSLIETRIPPSTRGSASRPLFIRFRGNAAPISNF